MKDRIKFHCGKTMSTKSKIDYVQKLIQIFDMIARVKRDRRLTHTELHKHAGTKFRCDSAYKNGEFTEMDESLMYKLIAEVRLTKEEFYDYKDKYTPRVTSEFKGSIKMNDDIRRVHICIDRAGLLPFFSLHKVYTPRKSIRYKTYAHMFCPMACILGKERAMANIPSDRSMVKFLDQFGDSTRINYIHDAKHIAELRRQYRAVCAEEGIDSYIPEIAKQKPENETSLLKAFEVAESTQEKVKVPPVPSINERREIAPKPVCQVVAKKEDPCGFPPDAAVDLKTLTDEQIIGLIYYLKDEGYLDKFQEIDSRYEQLRAESGYKYILKSVGGSRLGVINMILEEETENETA